MYKHRYLGKILTERKGRGPWPGSSPFRHRRTACSLSILRSAAHSAKAIKNILVFSGSKPDTTLAARTSIGLPYEIIFLKLIIYD